MKIVDIAQAATELASLLTEVENGEEVVIAREGKPIARLSKEPKFNRQPGILADHPAWKDFKYDPSIFAPLMTDDDLRADGWNV